jgi:aurora kinase
MVKLKNQSGGLSLVDKRELQHEPYKSNLTLDSFELGRKLGKGRFGDVHMAHEIRSGFALAIKVINKKELRES